MAQPRTCPGCWFPMRECTCDEVDQSNLPGHDAWDCKHGCNGDACYDRCTINCHTEARWREFERYIREEDCYE